MKCYICGTSLGKDIVCPGCGLQVKVYKKLIYTAEFYYNQALEKASVRDLSGAIEDLQRSLKFNKNQMDARNLLGLVYYEMGEVVSAIGEWVISKNLNPTGNRASHYLELVQKNQNHLDAANKTIKKYNQALMYTHQGDYDMAILQLKKVISMNPRYIRALQLLSLIYIHEKEYAKAKDTLKSALKIDAHNVTSLAYMQEVVHYLKADKKPDQHMGRASQDIIQYKNGNESIIRPRMSFRETSAGMTIINIIVGVVIGVLVTAFLVVPSVKQSAKSESNSAVSQANDTISTKDDKITSLEKQIETLEEKNQSLQSDVDDNDDKLTSYDYLLKAYEAYRDKKSEEAIKNLDKVNENHLSEDAKELYKTMSDDVNEEKLSSLYSAGYSAYNSYNYDTAVENLQEIVDTDETYKDGYAVYYLAQSYRHLEEKEKAITYYKRVLELCPNTSRSSTAQRYIDELSAAEDSNSEDTEAEDN